MKALQYLCLFIITICITLYNTIYAQQKLESITNIYDSKLKEENKGIAVLVKKNNTIENVSIGNFNLDNNHVFNIGSATKTFTAILILQEEEKGTLQLTDSIGKYLSPIKNVNGSLTIESLLKHQSGLGEIVGRDTKTYFYSTNDSIYNQNFLEKFPKNDPDMVGHYSYCNSNYILLGRILEKITDISYFDLVRERIFIPLHMVNSYPYVSKTIKNLAIPYDNNKNVFDLLDFRFFADYAYAAGSIASTLSDMEKFYTSLFETELLLKKESVHKMLPAKGESYGLGLMSFTHDNSTYYGHGGNNIGYAFRNLYDPKTKNVILFFNNTHSIPFEASLKEDLLDYVHNKLVVKKLNINISEDFKDFVGKYVLEKVNAELEIIIEKDQMFMLIQDQKVLLAYQDQNTLYDVKVGVRLKRNTDDNNTLTFTQGGFTDKLNKKIVETSKNKPSKK